MNNNIIKMLLIACSLFSICTGWAQLFVLPANDPHWNLVWHDEFNGDSINTSLWDFHAAWGNCSCSSSISPNQNNHNMHDGMVTLIAQQETDTCFMWQGGATPNYYSKPYTSGCLYSQDTFKYGFFEIRSRFPAINYRNFLPLTIEKDLFKLVLDSVLVFGFTLQNITTILKQITVR